MTPDDVLDLAETGAIGPAICARDLPLPPMEATLLLRAMSRAGLLCTMLPGVHTTMRTSTRLKRTFGVASEIQAIAAYGRLHRRMTLPAPAAAANMVGLSKQVPGRHMFVWNGPTRRLKVSNCPVDIDPMPDWTLDRAGDPSLPFLLALSAWGARWNAGALRALAGDLGPETSTLIAGTRRAGLPADLARCLDRFRRARRHVHRRIDAPTDPIATVLSVAASCAPADPFDRCRSTSAKMVSTLSGMGIPCVMLRCSGWHGGATPEADTRWLRTDPMRWVHYVVHVPGCDTVVDATWNQFDASADPVRIGTQERTRAEWRDVVEATS